MKTTPLYPSRAPVVLYYRNAVEVLQDLMKSPLICDSLNFTPLQIFEDSRKLVRVYDSWLSGNRAWQMQVSRPHINVESSISNQNLEPASRRSDSVRHNPIV